MAMGMFYPDQKRVSKSKGFFHSSLQTCCLLYPQPVRACNSLMDSGESGHSAPSRTSPPAWGAVKTRFLLPCAASTEPACRLLQLMDDLRRELRVTCSPVLSARCVHPCFPEHRLKQEEMAFAYSSTPTATSKLFSLPGSCSGI